MLEMIKGCKIADPSVLYEGYERIPSGAVANVDAGKILPLVERFVRLHDTWCFLILEVPTNAKDEAMQASGCLHKDVYYLDGMDPEKAIGILRSFGPWLVHDGMSSFGIGIHSGANEIVVGKYNVVSIYTKTPQQYQGFFEGQDIHEASGLKTAWDFFSVDAQGESFLYRYQGKTIYDILAQLKELGLYFAQSRED